MVYRHILPADQIYYMTARKQRFHCQPPHKELRDEVLPQPLHLLRVCRLVHQELWPLVYDQCVFYITIYSIRDLAYARGLLDDFTLSYHPFRSTDLFKRVRRIRIRVNDLILDVHPSSDIWCRALTAEFSQTNELWIGPGAEYVPKHRAQAARTVIWHREHDSWPDCYNAIVLKELIHYQMLRTPRLNNKATSNKMLPWYQRY
jgi:hypothetical protein